MGWPRRQAVLRRPDPGTDRCPYPCRRKVPARLGAHLAASPFLAEIPADLLSAAKSLGRRRAHCAAAQPVLDFRGLTPAGGWRAKSKSAQPRLHPWVGAEQVRRRRQHSQSSIESPGREILLRRHLGAAASVAIDLVLAGEKRHRHRPRAGRRPAGRPAQEGHPDRRDRRTALRICFGGIAVKLLAYWRSSLVAASAPWSVWKMWRELRPPRRRTSARRPSGSGRRRRPGQGRRRRGAQAAQDARPGGLQSSSPSCRCRSTTGWRGRGGPRPFFGPVIGLILSIALMGLGRQLHRTAAAPPPLDRLIGLSSSSTWPSTCSGAADRMWPHVINAIT